MPAMRRLGTVDNASAGFSISELIVRVRRGDQTAVGRALSVVINESRGFAELNKAFFADSGRAHKIGVSGPPGGGKSSLINRLVAEYRKTGEKIGILAVDPTSPFTGGAFLGDRLRVQEHTLDDGVFFRSLGSRGMVGGISATIFSAIHVLEAYGCGRILIETVGTGQDEVEISRVADSIVYVTAPSLGDEIQAMKAGAMEAADIFVVNKCDLAGADKAVASLRAALDLGSKPKEGWGTKVLGTSASTGEGIGDLVQNLEEHRNYLSSSAEGPARLKAQLKEELSLFISRRLYRDTVQRISDSDMEKLISKRIDPVTLGEQLIQTTLKRRNTTS